MSRMGAIFRAHATAYRLRFGSRMPAEHFRAMRDLRACHTAALGGIRWHCTRCGTDHFTYRSCGNRNCPACGQADASLWLERQKRLLLPGVTYHLLTFTVPEALRRIIRSNPRECLAMLFDCAASTLLDLCRDPRHVGGQPALTAVLHTWTRQLIYHPHVHFLASGGGLAADGAWRFAHPRFLVPVHGLSRVFAARFRDALRRHHPALFAHVPADTWRRSWVVHSKPVGSGGHALTYIARYLFRVALADSAILRWNEQQVIFRYRDSSSRKPRTARLTPQEFIRRFLQHVLPSRFRKVRHYGLHHSFKRKPLRVLQAQLALANDQSMPPTDSPRRAPLPPPVCAQRQSTLVPVEVLPRGMRSLLTSPRAPP